MEACSTLGSTILKTMVVRVSSNTESKEKMAVSQTEYKVDKVILVISAAVPHDSGL